MHAAGDPDHDLDAGIGYITAFVRPNNVVPNSVVEPSASSTCLVLQC